MPTYTYYCKVCEQKEEINHSMLSNNPYYCKKCNRIMIKKINNSTVIFTGSGFYKTDKGK